MSHGLSRSPWKEISQGLNTFSACCNFVMGNGERVRLWEDSWVEEIVFSHSFSHLCRLSQFQMFSFARMGVNSSSLPLAWNFGYWRNLNGREFEDLMSLLAKLDDVVLVSSWPDRRR